MGLTSSSPTVVLVTIPNCYFVISTPTDQRHDANAAAMTQVFVRIEPGGAGQGGELVLSMPTSYLPGVVSGRCSVTISQGGGGMAADGVGSTLVFNAFDVMVSTLTPTDHNDTSTGKMSEVFVYLRPGAGDNNPDAGTVSQQVGRLAFMVPTTALAGINFSQPCSLTLSQG